VIVNGKAESGRVFASIRIACILAGTAFILEKAASCFLLRKLALPVPLQTWIAY
jgi:hypothetical protein